MKVDPLAMTDHDPPARFKCDVARTNPPEKKKRHAPTPGEGGERCSVRDLYRDLALSGKGLVTHVLFSEGCAMFVLVNVCLCMCG